MDFPWHKPSSYGGTHDLGNLPYMFWSWSIPEGVNQWRILHHLWRSPASTWAHFFMASWPLGSLWDWMTHLWLCQLSWCFSSSMSVVSSKNTNSLGLAESSTPKLSKHLHQLEAFWQISLEQLGLSENWRERPQLWWVEHQFPYGLSGQTLGHFPQVISSLARQAVVPKPLN